MTMEFKFTTINNEIITIIAVNGNTIKYRHEGSTNTYSMSKNAFNNAFVARTK